jgi:DNA-binding transcriptional regulator GbsR (MarR family)
MNQTDPIQAMEDRFIDSLGGLGAELGISRAVAQIYCLLYLRDEPLSLDAMAERLGLSKATISVNVRNLERWGAVRRVWIEGSRRDHYLADRNTLGVVWSALSQGILRRLDQVGGSVAEAREDLARLRERARTREEKERLARTLDRVDEALGMETRVRKVLSAPDWLKKILGVSGRGRRK